MTRHYIRKITMKILCALVFCILTAFLPACRATVSAEASAKKVYLTFDDGPDPTYTPMVLNILRKEHVKATFFVLGYRSEKYPYLVRRTHRDGHEIGNHGYYHTFIVNKSKRWVETDIRKADAVIQALCGVKPKYFRPPGGILSEIDVGRVVKTGHPIAMWTVDTNDWKASSATSIIAAVKSYTRPNAIILMHDGTPASAHTVKALPEIIRYLRSAGYTFELLPEHFQGQLMGRPTDSTNYRFAKK